jgi:peptidoglycan/LPS O-acetylase OafA/YrhL
MKTGGRGGTDVFRPDIQGLRALAVGLVVIYHLYPSALPGGYVGVDLFFVISGYLITGGLLNKLQCNGRVSLVEFYGRRARRLMPAAALVLVVTWIGSRLILTASQLPAVATQIRASALYFQNWQLAHDSVSYLTANSAPSPVQHFWSLSVRGAVLPPLAVAVRHRRARRITVWRGR